MPSLYTLLALTALTFSTTATPLPTWPNYNVNAIPSLPTSSAATTQLPPPSTGLVLRYITLGRGIQNYTCAPGASTPQAIGAVATLFDITPLAFASPSSPLLTLLPAVAVYQKLPTGSAINGISYPGTDRWVVIGKHFFDAAGTPVFDLYSTGEKLVGKKVGQVSPPANAASGPAGTGAVLWLKLDDKGGSRGVKEVYRVNTAGGNPTPTCKKEGGFSIEYATEYWFYG